MIRSWPRESYADVSKNQCRLFGISPATTSTTDSRNVSPVVCRAAVFCSISRGSVGSLRRFSRVPFPPRGPSRLTVVLQAHGGRAPVVTYRNTNRGYRPQTVITGRPVMSRPPPTLTRHRACTCSPAISAAPTAAPFRTESRPVWPATR